ncbi:hypothetical protein DM02DRAFT_665684 [Periconia macrospinosa]|uniref:Transmembrane 9 superfamily member n=1 Tax=Periconia macrospinosa TaxID=97972 RepID=A0A2V1ECP2_9PLEO|nr:hypothetical protein DM02DRAFT_665684 [Periconia macrospinosa]
MRIEARYNALLCAAIGIAEAAWIPGFTPQTYRDGDIIPLLQSRVFPPHRSSTTDAPSLTPKQQTHIYAYDDLPIACPSPPRYTGSSSRIPLTLSHIARGDRISVSRHELIFGIDEVDKVLCTLELDSNSLRRIKELIAQGYREEWILDGLPGVRAWLNTTGTGRYYGQGVEIGARVNKEHNRGLVGKVEPPKYEIYNHVSLLVRYRTLGRKHERDVLLTLPETHWADEVSKAQGMDWERVIVGFELFPKSRKVSKTMTKGVEKRVQIWPVPTPTTGKTMRKGKKQQDGEEEKLKIPFTYSVYWREEKEEGEGGMEWRDRWRPFSAAGEEPETTVRYKFSVWLWVFWVLLGYWLASGRTDNVKDEEEGGIRLSSDPPRAARTAPPQPSKKTGKSKKSYGLLSPQHRNVTAPSSLSDDENEKSALSQHRPNPPTYNTTLLPPFLGAGIQVLAHLITIYPLYALNTLHAPYFSHFLTLAILIHLFLIPLSGYVSFYAHAASSSFPGSYPSSSSSLRHRPPRQNTLLTICTLPALVFTGTFLLNTSVWWQAGGTAVPFATLSTTCTAWLLVQSILVYAGSQYAAIELTENNLTSNTHNNPLQQTFTLASAARAVSIGGLPITNTIPRTKPSSSSSYPLTLALAKPTLISLLAATTPFLTAFLAAKITSFVSSCSMTHINLLHASFFLRLTLDTEWVCSDYNYHFNNINPTPPSLLLIITIAGLTFLSTVMFTSTYLLPITTHIPTTTTNNTKHPPPPPPPARFLLSHHHHHYHPLFLPTSSPTLLLFVGLLYQYLTNPMRPAGIVPAVLHTAVLASVCVAFGMGLAGLRVLGVVVVLLVGSGRVWKGKGKREEVEAGGKEK